jgi:hypothetical protein
MKCDEARDMTDKLVFETENLPSERLIKHLKTCSDCRKYEEQRQEQSRIILSLKNNEPALKDPLQLTDDILLAIESDDRQLQQTKSAVSIDLFIKWMAAACIALFITFGLEQYVVLEKMIQLESNSMNITQQKSFTSSALDLQALNSFRVQQFLKSSENDNISREELMRLVAREYGSKLHFSKTMKLQFLINQLNGQDIKVPGFNN